MFLAPLFSLDLSIKLFVLCCNGVFIVSGLHVCASRYGDVDSFTAEIYGSVFMNEVVISADCTFWLELF